MIGSSQSCCGVDMTDLTVPLAERAQYASTDWIETARRYLASREDASPPFSFSMTLDNVPPHLNAESSTPYGYTVRVGDGAAAVEDRPDARRATACTCRLQRRVAVRMDEQRGRASRLTCARREYAALSWVEPDVEGEVARRPGGPLHCCRTSTTTWRGAR